MYENVTINKKIEIILKGLNEIHVAEVITMEKNSLEGLDSRLKEAEEKNQQT